jgi:hypothetical protein
MLFIIRQILTISDCYSDISLKIIFIIFYNFITEIRLRFIIRATEIVILLIFKEFTDSPFRGDMRVFGGF